jgi:glucose/arabinose dehydrogenase
MSMLRSSIRWLCLIAVMAGCTGTAPNAKIDQGRGEALVTDAATGFALPKGIRVERVAEGLKQPTHIAIGPDGAYYLTQLNGGENDGNGQVVKIAKAGAAPDIILEKLFKPTGLTWADGNLYIVAGNSVLRSKVHDEKVDDPEPLFSNLPFNGRSEGQIFTGPDGKLYFQGTGNEGKINESGFIYTAKPDGTDQKIYARGFKNAYAMAWDTKSGKMYATEIADGQANGSTDFPDELNIVYSGGNYGWPLCYGNQLENRALGGNRNICADTDAVIAEFPEHATPTGLAVFDGALIVTLWNGNPPRLVKVDVGTGNIMDFGMGFKRPIALLADGDTLLVVDMESGVMWRLVHY